MYATDIDTLFIEIPRTGMRSLEFALRGVYRVSHVGHYTVQRFLDCVKAPPTNYVAVIRDPLDRLLSAVNFSCNTKEQVDQAFSKLLINGYSTEIIAPSSSDELEYVYAPQTAYLNADVNYRLYRFDDMMGFYNSCGIGKSPPHKNISKKWFSLEALQSHHLFSEIMQVYKKDVDLYKTLKLTP